MQLIKFNFKHLDNKLVSSYLLIVVVDLILLSLYILGFHFNKYIYYGPEHVHTSNIISPQYIDLSKMSK